MGTNIGKITIENFLLCDDVRREDNGKEILIGVYSGGLLVPKFPVNLNLLIWAQHVEYEVGSHTVNIRVVNKDGTEFLRAEGEINVKSLPSRGSLGFGFPFQAQGETELLFEMCEPGGEWKTVLNFKISKMDNQNTVR